MWIISMIISILLCLMAWKLSFNKNKKAALASVGSLAFSAITLLMDYRMVLNWTNKHDWTALLDVVPSMFKLLFVYIIIIVIANIIPCIIMTRE